MSKTIRKGKSNISQSAENVAADTSTPQTLADERKSASASPENQQNSLAYEETIRVLAHSKWEAAGCPTGDGMYFWLEAEKEAGVGPQTDN